MRNNTELPYSYANKPSIGDKREQFALYPIPCYATPHPFTQRKGWYWLQKVVQVRTITEGWIAYENDNLLLRKLPDRTVFWAEVMIVIVLFAYVAWVIYPLTDLL